MGGEHVHLAAVNEDMAVGVDTVGRRGRWASVREEREGERERTRIRIVYSTSAIGHYTNKRQTDRQTDRQRQGESTSGKAASLNPVGGINPFTAMMSLENDQ